MTLTGKVYQLSASHCDHVYIGSTYSKYLSVRTAHHRQNHRNKWKDYKGLFDKGDPIIEVLEEIELENRDSAWKLRELEEKYAQKNENIINIRRCYLTPDEKKEQTKLSITKYHNSPLGKLSMRKGYLNTKRKKTTNKELIKQIDNELKFLSQQQDLLRNDH
jgi:hypothetical protein